ncbi:MAG: hypothetical protein QOF68_2734 [Gaiellales bacterium]|jgi:predicted metal-binding membrane protein|nr:hypothetical protein [Gaiellales bacterium]
MDLVAGHRSTTATGAALLASSAVAWLLLAGYDAPMGLAGFLAGWTLMMTAMMLPSIAPLILLYRGSRTTLVSAYLATWAAIGLLPYAAMEMDLMPPLALVLGLAGVYELSPLKTACLRRCRNVAGFLMEHYRSGPIRLGFDHALWCIGCCAGLMVVLVLAASMSLAWAAAIAAVVFVQKVLPTGELSARLTGVGLVGAAMVAAVM